MSESKKLAVHRYVDNTYQTEVLKISGTVGGCTPLPTPAKLRIGVVLVRLTGFGAVVGSDYYRIHSIFPGEDADQYVLCHLDTEETRVLTFEEIVAGGYEVTGL
jgi:hypothetical protein